MQFSLLCVRFNVQQLAPDRWPSGASVMLRAYLIPFSSTLPSVSNLSSSRALCSMWPLPSTPILLAHWPWPFCTYKSKVEQ